MRKSICLILVAMLTLSLTACGSSSSTSSSSSSGSSRITFEQEPSVNSNIEDFSGEGEVTGGIPTDEELAEREAEGDSYATASDDSASFDYADANFEMETTPTAADTFISSDNFWNGEDYFDLEEYYWMNGARNVLYSEDNRNYPPYAVFNGWIIHSAGSGCFVSKIHDAGEPTNEYEVFGEFLNEPPSVRVNDDGAMIMRNLPAMLDKVVPCLIEYGDQDDPFSNTELSYAPF